MYPRLSLLLVACLSLSSAVHAAEPSAPLKATLETLLPGLKPDSIEQTPIEGLYEVRFGAQVLYLTGDGRYFVRGNLIDLKSHEDLTEKAQDTARKALLADLDENKMIIFSPKRPKHTITVFTDVDCPYCRKLHQEIEQYLDAGIAVRYVLFPRTDIGSPSFNKAVSVWCAQDRKAALTQAKKGEEVPAKTCDNPIIEQTRLGQLSGITGTPAIVLESGEMVSGYQPAPELIASLDDPVLEDDEKAHND